jgi:hypothetical protein
MLRTRSTPWRSAAPSNASTREFSIDTDCSEGNDRENSSKPNSCA